MWYADAELDTNHKTTAAVTLKGKSVAIGGMRAVNTLSDIHVKEVDREFSPPAIMPEVGVNHPEAQHPTKGQLLRMLTISKNNWKSNKRRQFMNENKPPWRDQHPELTPY